VQVEQPSGSTKSFTFNVTFEPGATQEDVFENSGVKKLVDMAVEGCVSLRTLFNGNSYELLRITVNNLIHTYLPTLFFFLNRSSRSSVMRHHFCLSEAA